MQLIQSQQAVMNSFELRELVNRARAEFGESQVRNDQFIARVEDELSDDLEGVQKIFIPHHGNNVQAYPLTLEQCMLIGMRESKGVRRQVLEKIKDLESKKTVQVIPDFSNPAVAARAWAEQYEAKQALAIERDHAIATKAEIGSRREATAMNTASVAVRKANSLERQLDKAKDYCTVKRMSMIHHGQHFDWRSLKAASAEMELPPIDVFDQNYGTVKAYHVDVWAEVYGLGIDQ
jgi:hypothetical protein